MVMVATRDTGMPSLTPLTVQAFPPLPLQGGSDPLLYSACNPGMGCLGAGSHDARF